MLRCGIDLIETKRMAEGIERFGQRFLNRFFTPAEQGICAGQVERLAARFAAKEAVSKALGTGIGDISWLDIEILQGERYRPVLVLHREAARVAAELNLTEWDISLTHTESYASAVVVALGQSTS